MFGGHQPNVFGSTGIPGSSNEKPSFGFPRGVREVNFGKGQPSPNPIFKPMGDASPFRFQKSSNITTFPSFSQNTNSSSQVTVPKDDKKFELIVEAFWNQAFFKAKVVDFLEDEVLLNFMLADREMKIPYSDVRFPPENVESTELKVGDKVEFCTDTLTSDGWKVGTLNLIQNDLVMVDLESDQGIALRPRKEIRKVNANPPWDKTTFEKHEVNVEKNLGEQQREEIIKKLCEDTEAIFVRYIEETRTLLIVIKQNGKELTVSEMITKYINLLQLQSADLDCSLNDTLLKELECPVCTLYIVPPIRLCETGHSICNRCATKLPKCPLCETPSMHGRNYALQAIAEKVLYPCSNASHGCLERFKLNQRKSHEDSCKYNKFPCGIETCQWTGNREDILKHFSDETKKTLYGNNRLCRTSLQTSSTVDMMQANDELFWVKTKITTAAMYWSVQYIGPADKANNYTFRIMFERPDKGGRRIILEDHCHPFNVLDSTLLSEEGCPSTSISSLKMFKLEGDAVVFNLSIFKT